MNLCPAPVFIPYALLGAALLFVVGGVAVARWRPESLTAGYGSMVLGLLAAAGGLGTFLWSAAPYPRGPLDVLRCLLTLWQ